MLLDVADEPVALQRRDVGRRAVALEVCGAGVDPERVVGQLAGDEPPRFRLVEANDDIDLAPRERGQLRQRHQLEAHARMTLGEVAQRRCEVIGREPVRRADAHIAREFEIDAGDLALRVQECALHLLRRADEPLARAGELRPGRAAVEQLRADRRLERRDPAADRCMVELEPLGGGDELAAARDREKDANVVPVQRSRSPIHPASRGGERRELPPSFRRSRGRSFPRRRL